MAYIGSRTVHLGPEQRTGFYTVLDEHLDTPFDTEILWVTATVERIEMTDDEQIVAICRRGRRRQAIA